MSNLRNLVKAFLMAIFVVGAVYAIDSSLNLTSGQVLTEQTWTDLVNKIDSLETQLNNSYTKNEVDALLSSSTSSVGSGGIVGGYQVTSGTCKSKYTSGYLEGSCKTRTAATRNKTDNVICALKGTSSSSSSYAGASCTCPDGSSQLFGGTSVYCVKD